MPSWSETHAELAGRRTPQGTPDFDGLRRERLARVEAHTHRPLVVYAADFLDRQKVAACGGEVEIELADRDGVIEVTRNLSGRAVDVLLHSPGGLPDAADSLVHILRNRFKNVRFIIPGVAKSAATMMALSADRLLLDRNAELGPIDPQFRFVKGDGTPVLAPAQAILDQFEKAQSLLREDPKKLPAWLPILQQYGPALYQQCKNAIELSKDYVRKYLTTWMFRRSRDRERRAEAVVTYLGDHNRFKTHGARVGPKDLRAKGVVVDLLESDPVLRDLILDVMYALSSTFRGTGVFKLFENSRGEALVRMIQVFQLPAVPARPGPSSAGSGSSAPSPSPKP